MSKYRWCVLLSNIFCSAQSPTHVRPGPWDAAVSATLCNYLKCGLVYCAGSMKYKPTEIVERK